MTFSDEICSDLKIAARFLLGDTDIDSEEANRVALSIAALAGTLRAVTVLNNLEELKRSSRI